MTGRTLRRAVFVDRDGTLNEEVGYLDRLERLTIFPYSAGAVRLLNERGFLVVVVTNQAGIARGLLTASFLEEAHRHIGERFASAGARIDAFYHCPHHPDGVIEPLRQRCGCRKPQPGLLMQAAADLAIDLPRSFVVGDRWHDLEAGQAVGVRGVLVRTGYGKAEEQSPKPGVAPAAIVDDLMAAAEWILRRST